MLVAALVAYTLPPRAQRRAQVLALIATAVAGTLLITDLPLVGDGGRVEAATGSLVRGVPLTLRGDQTGVWLALIACAACLLALSEGRRSPLERTALLLCLGGTLTACLAANAVLLVAGLEIANAGAFLLSGAGASAGDGGRRRAVRIIFVVQHLASLALLAAAVELIRSQGTADLAAVPPGAVTAGIALTWGLCGLVRLAGLAVLPAARADERAVRPTDAWLAVAAVPCGLVVLLRLVGVAGGDLAVAVPVSAHLLLAAGLLIAAAGAVVAFREHRRAMVAGRALCVSAAGQVVVLVGAGGAGSVVAAAALGVALLLAVAAAPAWAPGGDAGRGGAGGEPRPAVRLRALALATAGGLPCGAGAAALLAGAGAEVAPGGGAALVAVIAGATALVAAVAGALAAAAILNAPAGPPVGRAWRSLRLEACVSMAASGALAIFPGTLLGGLAGAISGGASPITAVDALAVRGPGFGWAGGYLSIAMVVAIAAALSAAALQGATLAGPGALLPSPAVTWPAPVGPAAAMAVAEAEPAPAGGMPAARLRSLGGRLEGWLAAIDRWLIRQPDVPVIVTVGIVLVIWFQYRP